MELYLDGHRIELSEKEISQTYQVNDLAEIKNRQANFTNRFKIPLTPNNVEVMDYLGIVGNNSRKPYTKVPAKLVEDGIELVSSGYAIIKGTSGYYEAVVYDGNISLYDKLKGKRINDLDYTDINHVLNVTTFQESLSNEEGYIHALADFGRMGYSTIITDYTPAAVFVSTLWHKIFTEAGFTYSGVGNSQYPNGIFSKPKYKISAVSPIRGYEISAEPDTVTSLGTAELDSVSVSIEKTEGLTEYEHFFEFTGELDKVITNPEIPTELVFDFTGTCKLNFDMNFSVVGGIGSLYIKINDSFTGVPFDAEHKTSFISVKKGDKLSLKVKATGLDDAVGSDVDFLIVHAGGSVAFSEVTGGSFLDYNKLMPDSSQIDFVKDIMQRFGLMFRKRRNEDHYEFIEIQELLNDRLNAEDWSDKFISSSESYKVGPYAQRNSLEYEYDDNVEAFANGTLDIDNETLEDSKTLFTSIFKATQTSRSLGGVDLYSIPLWEKKEEDGKNVYNPKDTDFRIFEIVRRQANIYIKADASANTIKLPVEVPFLDFEPCHYQKYVDNFYRSFKRILDDSKKITSELLLDPVDIYNLDFFRLKYIKQLGAYYYLNKGKNFRKHRSTKVELIEVKQFDFNSPPTSVGDIQKTIEHIGSYVFTWDDFTYGTNPSYSDPDGDAPISIKISSLFDKADLTLNDVAVVVDQEIQKADIVAGHLQVTVHDYEETFVTEMNFKVKSENSDYYSRNEGTVTLDVQARVNQAPVVNAGSDVNLTLPTNSVTLSGSASDDKGVTSTEWTKQDGGVANIVSPNNLETQVLNLESGNYTFRLTATDTDGSEAFDELIVKLWSKNTDISHDFPEISQTTNYIVSIDGEPDAEVTLEAITDPTVSAVVDTVSIGHDETKILTETLNDLGKVQFSARVSADDNQLGTLTIKITALSKGMIGMGWITLDADGYNNPNV